MWRVQPTPDTLLKALQTLEDEDPQLHVNWRDDLGEVHVQLMGEVQLEILQNILQERFGLDVTFSEGGILYKETLTAAVEGIGHYEPLRHYAEVHLLLEPAPRGSGVQLAADCPPDTLAENWQRLILTHLAERTHPGVLIGAPLTDVRITLAAGRAHQKHTEGGDFRQATYRAVRQGPADGCGGGRRAAAGAVVRFLRWSCPPMRWAAPWPMCSGCAAASMRLKHSRIPKTRCG